MTSRSFQFIPLALAALFAAGALVAEAQEHRVEALNAPAPAESIPKEIHGRLAETGLKVLRGSSRTVCDLWFCQKLPTTTEFKPTPDRLYPFQPGDLIGVLRFPRRGKDFRDQQISRGVYTLRYALQPIDGNHVGTSPTRDFLLLVKAEDDAPQKQWTAEELNAASAAAAGSSHPAMLCLQPARSERTEPTMRHDEEKDWWILQWRAQAAPPGSAEAAAEPLPIDLIIAGHADE